jgi:hypothetical protein
MHTNNNKNKHFPFTSLIAHSRSCFFWLLGGGWLFFGAAFGACSCYYYFELLILIFTLSLPMIIPS